MGPYYVYLLNLIKRNLKVKASKIITKKYKNKLQMKKQLNNQKLKNRLKL